MALVYMVISPSGKKYVGKTVGSMNKRKKCHQWYAKNGSSFPLHKAIRKYNDKMKWSTYSRDITEEEATDMEVFLISKLKTLGPNGYNCTLGGEGSTGWVASKETRSRMSASGKGRKFSKEHKNKIATALSGKKRSMEVKEKISRKLMDHNSWHDGKSHKLYVTNKTGYTGVCKKTKNRFCAQINVTGKKIYLGLFHNITDAAVAYNKAAIKYFGKHATLNTIPKEFVGVPIE